jgi:hypothetical protein
MNDSKMLTVVVVDEKGQPAVDVVVSIKPSDASLVTNNAGEVQFKLGDATKYDITASYGSSKVTVPYYVTKDGATRLVVNPVYVKSVEAKLHPSWFTSPIALNTGAVLSIFILLFFIWKFFVRRR